MSEPKTKTLSEVIDDWEAWAMSCYEEDKNTDLQKCIGDVRQASEQLNAENAELRADMEKAVQRQSEIMDEMDAMYSPKVVALWAELKRVAEARDSLQVLFGELDDSWENLRKKWLVEVETQCQRAENAERALNIATTDKEMALKELGKAREYLAIEVGPEMWHLDEVDKAILTERIRCAGIANMRGLNQDCDPFPELYAYGRRIADAIADAIMEDPK